MSAVAENADSKRCFAFLGSQFTLSLEAETEGKRAMWVGGIDRIISSTRPSPSKRTIVPVEVPLHRAEKQNPQKKNTQRGGV